MNKKQKEIITHQLSAEEKEMLKLKKIYEQAYADITDNIAKLLGRQDKDMQHVIYQVDYQKSLKSQIGSILDAMNSKQFENITQYITECYEDGFIGTMYDLHGQGIPLIMPIDQDQVVKAMKTDSKIKETLYKKLGIDVAELKKNIANSLSRGIASNMSYSEIASLIDADSNTGYNKAKRIARTEGHRVAMTAAYDAQQKAKAKGADIVKQWDASLDKRTRDSHAKVDGEIRELGEEFSNGLMFPSDPNGEAGEVINCRCALLQRAKWALDEEELETLQQRAEYFELDKTENFEDFKKKYLNAVAEPPPKKEYLTEKKLQQKIQELTAKVDDGTANEEEIKELEEYQDKLNKKLTKKEIKKLTKEQLALQEQADNFPIKTYSGIWKDDVTTADWGEKHGAIEAKKKYFEKKWMMATDEAEGNKWTGYINQLKEFDTQGAAYFGIKQQIDKVKKQIADLKKPTGMKLATPFTPDAYGQRKDVAWKNRFTDKNKADKYFRPLLDADWNNLSDEEKFAVWQYTHNSHPINRPLSGYDRMWGSRSYFKGLDGIKWNNESDTNYDAVLHSTKFISKFANAKSSTYGGDIRKYSDVISDLTKAIDKSVLQDDLWFVRGSGADGLAGLLDGNKISYQQAENLIKAGDIQGLKQLIQNEVFQMHSFTSTGIADGTGFGGEVSYKIYAPKGTKAIYAEPQSYFGHTISNEELYVAGKSYNNVGGEAEVIIQRGTSYRIVDVKKHSYRGIEIIMEVVEQPDYFKTGYEHTFDGGLTSEK